jgi:hypothetical protein
MSAQSVGWAKARSAVPTPFGVSMETIAWARFA